NDFDPFLDLDTLDDADRGIPQTKTNNVTDAVEGSNREEGNDREEGSDSESSNGNDSDELVDNENPIEHIYVNMDTFDKNKADKFDVEDRQGELNSHENTDVDLDVIDNEEFESASDEDRLERVRQRKLKQLRKQNKPKHGDVHKYYFYVRQEFVSREKASQVTKEIGESSQPASQTMMQPSVIADSFYAEVPIKAIQDHLQKKYQVEVSRMKAFSAKSKAVNQVRGDYTSQYHILRSYVMELKASNPNTTVRIGVESAVDHTYPTRFFKRIYMCLDVAKADLELQDNSNFTFISDRQKGIIPAIEELFPVAEHNFCLRHIYENMKSK
nr:hypothetical protein [Tanacetum cinerariifolium]